MWAELGIGTLVAGAVGGTYAILRRKRALKTAWRSLSAELEQIREAADGFLGDTPPVPLWRCPTTAYKHDWGIAREQVNVDEMQLIQSHFTEVETLNRGMDEAAAAKSNEEKLKAVSRNKLKAKRLASGAHSYREVRRIMDRFVKPEWWEKLPML